MIISEWVFEVLGTVLAAGIIAEFTFRLKVTERMARIEEQMKSVKETVEKMNDKMDEFKSQ